MFTIQLQWVTFLQRTKKKSDLLESVELKVTHLKFDINLFGVKNWSTSMQNFHGGVRLQNC